MEGKNEEALEPQTNLEGQEAGVGEDEAFAAAFGKAVSGEAQPESKPDAEAEEGRQPAPAAGEDEGGAAAQPGEASADDTPEVRRLAQQLDMTQGRLRKVQEDLAAMRQKAQGGTEAAKLLEQVPEEIREDAEAFAKKLPSHADLLREDSRDGDRLRRLLSEYGPDHVLVEEYAERMADKRQEQLHASQELAGMEAEVRVAFFEAVNDAHPDFGALALADLSEPKNLASLDAYKARVNAWIETKPFKEGKELERIATQGTAPEVIAMLTMFKKETGHEARQERTRQAAEAGMVPPTKPAPRVPPGDDKPEGTYEAGWAAGVKKKKE